VNEKRIAVLISGNGSNLQAILNACAQGEIPARVVRVISNKADAYGLERARRAGVETTVLDHRQFQSREAFDQAMQAILDADQPNIIALAGFMRILTPDFVAHFMGRMINIHPSLLPKYPGLNTHSRALEAGDSEHGCSVHFVTAEVDSGPVIIQGVTAIQPDDDASSLQARVHQLEHQIYPLALRWMAEGRLRLSGSGVAQWDGCDLLSPAIVLQGGDLRYPVTR